ncbi:MAG: AMP-binding protein [Alphaproteobacteria bacterium]|nr:AMP-binding protein [Alphaproteobacteria bacterium]
MASSGDLTEAGYRPASADTFPKLLRYQAATRGDRPASREKSYGIWESWAWSQVRDNVRELACGLHVIGVKRGDKIAIVGDNRPRLYWTFVAAQSLGAIPVPVYQDSVADEMRYVLDHAEIRFAVAEDQEQVDKLLEIKDRCPLLERIVYEDPRGLRHYDHRAIEAYNEVQKRGRDFALANPGFLDAEIDKGRGADVAVMLYTSGTTGQPKGCMLSFDNLLITAENAARFDRLTADDEVLAYLPMAWVGDHIFSFAEAYVAGFCVACPESGDTVLNDLRELGPTFFFAPPRVFENLLTTVTIRMEDAGAPKRWMFRFFMGVARRSGSRIMDGEPVSVLDRLLYALGRWLVYEPLKNTLGFSRVRICYTAGEAIGPDMFAFYRSLGMNMKQLYGQTEAAVFIAMQPDGKVKRDTVGTPAPQVDIKIDDTGEVLFKSPGVFLEYYKNPKATAEAKTADGWVHTGDAGYLDQDGQLKIIDRAKDVGKLANGALFAPKYIENKLKFYPYIREAVAFGDGRDRVCVFINIDMAAVGDWAERRNIAYGGYQELAGRPEVYDLIRGNIEEVNRDLAADAHMADAQVSRFLILPKELDADDGELTRTRKVRRGFIADRYNLLVAALYANRDHVELKMEVRFEDGRASAIQGRVRVGQAKTFPPAQAAGPSPGAASGRKAA